MLYILYIYYLVNKYVCYFFHNDSTYYLATKLKIHLLFNNIKYSHAPTLKYIITNFIFNNIIKADRQTNAQL